MRRLFIEATGMTEADANTPRLTKVDAYLFDAWRIAACDPEVFVGAWLKGGAPAGITMPINDPGILLACIRPADAQPEDLRCDERRFNNYPGVEYQDVTDNELESHLKKSHLAAFNPEQVRPHC